MDLIPENLPSQTNKFLQEANEWWHHEGSHSFDELIKTFNTKQIEFDYDSLEAFCLFALHLIRLSKLSECYDLVSYVIQRIIDEKFTLKFDIKKETGETGARINGRVFNIQINVTKCLEQDWYLYFISDEKKILKLATHHPIAVVIYHEFGHIYEFFTKYTQTMNEKDFTTVFMNMSEKELNDKIKFCSNFVVPMVMEALNIKDIDTDTNPNRNKLV